MNDALVAGGLSAASAACMSVALRIARRRSLLARAGVGALERSRRRLEVRWSAPVAAAGGAVAGAALAGPVGVLAGAAMGAAGWLWLRRRRASRDAALLDEQLGDAIASIAAGLRAGLSLSQAIRFSSDEGDAPLAPTLRELIDRSSMGVPFDDALTKWAGLHDGPDVRLVAGVLRLHRRTGGDLPRVLDSLAETLSERRAGAREIRSLTAQARLSGAILGFLPIGFFLFMSVTSREDIAAAYRSSLGATAIALGLVMQGAAFLWIRRLLRVE